MQGEGAAGEACPFDFNFDPATFKVGDAVSYRCPKDFQDFPFAGALVEVGPDYVVVTSDPSDPQGRLRATRESRPVVHDMTPVV
jgi:hypothetical protein